MQTIKKIDWKQKLTSGKFGAALIGFITTMLVAFGIPNLQIEQTIAVITAGATLIAYIIGEGMVDAARIEKGASKDETDSKDSDK